MSTGTPPARFDGANAGGYAEGVCLEGMIHVIITNVATVVGSLVTEFFASYFYSSNLLIKSAMESTSMYGNGDWLKTLRWASSETM